MIDYIPTVGDTCEVSYHGAWFRTFIVGKDSQGSYVFEVPLELNLRYSFDSDTKENFRPIKTSEQVEREQAIEKALSLDCEPQEGMLSRYDFCGSLYDAGLLHNQPKVKALSYGEYVKICNDSRHPKAVHLRLGSRGYIIEAKTDRPITKEEFRAGMIIEAKEKG